MKKTIFDEEHVLLGLKQYLPTQTPLKDFIHHNSLHAFRDMKFYDAIFRASKIFGYQVTLQLSEYRKLYETGRIKTPILEKIVSERKGDLQMELWMHKLLHTKYHDSNNARIGSLRSNWKLKYQFDLDNAVQPLLFRILCSYLDQGVSIWDFPIGEDGFLSSVKNLEKNSFSSFFKTARAKKLLLSENVSIEKLLKLIVGNESYYEQYLFDQQFSHRGWSGMVATVEQQPDTLLAQKTISLKDLIIFELLLEIDALDFNLGKDWQPLENKLHGPALDLFLKTPETELNDILRIWQDAFEWSYYDEVLAGIVQKKKIIKTDASVTSFQSIFCIDERECSFRRHIERVDPHCETLGSPGFFGVAFYFQPEHAKFYNKLCPASITPKHLIKEFDVKGKRKHELLYTNKTNGLVTGFFSSIVLGFWAGLKTIQGLFSPSTSPAFSNAFSHMHKHSQLTIENKNDGDKENGLQVGYTISEMAEHVEALLRGIGLTEHFAPLVYVVAHGSSSANNPHHGAHDCGACSGKPGSVNARVFSFMANHPEVRLLLTKKGIHIPITTQFIGGLHDTACDEIEFYDTDITDSVNAADHKKNIQSFEKALDLNAKERSRRFASINTNDDAKKIRRAVKNRSVSLFEPRPELANGTNTLCIVGNRELTKGLFLDRRAFLNSYDYKTDPQGKFLTSVLQPLGPVCGSINLQYYFSRVDNYKLGAGTKLPHHVMGLLGVANSSDGDLRPGLPLQLVEVHDPVRLLIIVEHLPEIVLNAIKSEPEIYEWFINEWVQLAVINPHDKSIHYFKEGSFIPYTPLSTKVNVFTDLHNLIETATKMETNNIVDATKENLPVYLYN